MAIRYVYPISDDSVIPLDSVGHLCRADDGTVWGRTPVSDVVFLCGETPKSSEWNRWNRWGRQGYAQPGIRLCEGCKAKRKEIDWENSRAGRREREWEEKLRRWEEVS